MGFTFLWAFLDKAFSLGFATGRNPETGAINLFGPDAWINGASPTEGFLSFGLHTKDPFLSFYQGLAGSAVIDWIYMLSMLGIGIALMARYRDPNRGARWGYLDGDLLHRRRALAGKQPSDRRSHHRGGGPGGNRLRRSRTLPGPRKLVEEDRAGP